MVRSVPDNVKPQTVLFSTEAPLPAAISYSFSLRFALLQPWQGTRCVAATRCQFYRQAMAYKEAKPQSFVRIVASMLTRVM